VCGTDPAGIRGRFHTRLNQIARELTASFPSFPSVQGLFAAARTSVETASAWYWIRLGREEAIATFEQKVTKETKNSRTDNASAALIDRTQARQQVPVEMLLTLPYTILPP
jgi:hypothetical protein